MAEWLWRSGLLIFANLIRKLQNTFCNLRIRLAKINKLWRRAEFTMKTSIFAGIVALTLIPTLLVARAADRFWMGGAGAWNRAANWGDHVPGKAGAAKVVRGGTVSLTEYRARRIGQVSRHRRARGHGARRYRAGRAAVGLVSGRAASRFAGRVGAVRQRRFGGQRRHQLRRDEGER